MDARTRDPAGMMFGDGVTSARIRVRPKGVKNAKMQQDWAWSTWGGAGFQGAAARRRLSQWLPNKGTINTLVTQGGEILRDRARDMVRNNPHAASAADSYVGNLIGSGIKPSSTIPDPDLRQEVNRLWADWSQECDADNMVDFYGMQEIVARSIFEAGEVFIRFRPRAPEDGLCVPLQLHLIESDLLDYAYNMLAPNGNLIMNGVEFDNTHRRVAYHFWPYHPGQVVIEAIRDFRYRVRVPADEILHIFKPRRPGDVRGVPLVSSALVKLFMLDQYDDAELDRKKVAAMFAGFVKSPSPEDMLPDMQTAMPPASYTGDDGLVTLEPGTIQTLLPGEDITFSQPAAVGGDYEPFQYRQLLPVFQAMGVPYALGTGDLRRANYSSLRGAIVEYRRRLTQMQTNCIIFQMCKPIWNRWLRDAVFSRSINIRDFASDPRTYLGVKWIPPRWEWVDPLKDQHAEKLAVDSGFKARSDVIEEMGDDPLDIDLRIKQDHLREKALGLDFPSSIGAKGGGDDGGGNGGGGGGSTGEGGDGQSLQDMLEDQGIDVDEDTAQKLAAHMRERFRMEQEAARFRAAFDPDQPREPKGSPDGGKWTSAGGSGEGEGGAAEGGGYRGATQDAYHGSKSAGFEHFHVPDAREEFMMDRAIGIHVAKDPKVAEYFTKKDATSGWRDRPAESTETSGGVYALRIPTDDKILTVDQPLHPYIEDRNTPKKPGNVASDQTAIGNMVWRSAFSQDQDMFARFLERRWAMSKDDAAKAADDILHNRPWKDSGLVVGKDRPPIVGLDDYIKRDGVISMMGSDEQSKNDRAHAVDLFHGEMNQRGILGLKYINTSPMETEGVDDPSAYIIFDPKNIRHKYTGATARLRREFRADFDPEKHPREPSGTPEGGQFTEAGGDTGEGLNPDVIGVGGDKWNRQTAIRLEREYQAARPDLEKLANDAVGKEVEFGDEDEDEEHYAPGSWDEMSQHDQEATFEKWKEVERQHFVDSEIEHWQSEQAPDDAKDRVARDFDEGSDWAIEALHDLHEFDEKTYPVDDEDILKATSIEFEPGWGSHTDKGLKITIDDAKLPTPLTDEQKGEIVDKLKGAFVDAADKELDDMEPPDYLSESVDEYMDQYWDSMDDSSKFEFAGNNDIIQEETHDDAAQTLSIEGLPQRYDPLNERSDNQYQRTQALARYMGVERGADLVMQRGAAKSLKEIELEGRTKNYAKLLDQPERLKSLSEADIQEMRDQLAKDTKELAAIQSPEGRAKERAKVRDNLAENDKYLWGAWKSSSTSDFGKLLQVATAEELGGRLNTDHREFGDVKKIKDDADKRFDEVGGYEGIKAFVRGKWETSQYLMDKAGINRLNLYRAINMSNLENEPRKTVADMEGRKYTQFTDMPVKRNGAASTSLKDAVSNEWDGSRGRVVLRADVPRTAVLSIPAYGINETSEREVVVAGTAWHGWDAWDGKAPMFETMKMGGEPRQYARG